MTKQCSVPIVLVVAIAAASSAFAQGAQRSAPYTARQALDDRVSVVEQQIVPAAVAMPESLYTYAPAGGAFAGVRTFAEQLKHLAAANWQLGSKVLGERPPAGTHDETAPAS